MKRLLAAMAAPLILAFATPAAAGEVTLRELDAEDFPTVRLLMSVGGDKGLDPTQLSIQENGTTLQSTRVDKLRESGTTVEVVLVIDTSGSMEGEAMASAIAAARLFVKEMPPDLRVGIVTFSDSATVRLAPTLDQSEAEEILKGLKAQGETAMNDALIEAARTFSPRAQKNVVLLSDGGDTASSSTLQRAVRTVARRDVTVFPVGLRTPETDVAALKRLADRTGGRYSPAATAELTDVYVGIADEISGQFVVTYRSRAENAAEVSVSVHVSGMGGDTLLYLSPDAPKEPEVLVLQETQSLVHGRGGLLLIIACTFGAVFLLVYMLVGIRTKSARERHLKRRLSMDKAPHAPQEGTVESEKSSWIPSGAADVAEKLVSRTDLPASVDRSLDRAGLALQPGEFVLIVAAAALAGTIVGAIGLGSVIGALAVGAIAGLAPPMWVARKGRKRMEKLKGQLPDVLAILASSLRVGHSFQHALGSVAQEISAPASTEFSRALAEIRLGRSSDEALDDLAGRVGSEDLDWALTAVKVQREVGGNLAEILDTVAGLLRERTDVRRQVQVLSAEGKLSAWILSLLPFGIGLYMWAVNPDSISMLIETGLGRAMLAGTGILLLSGVLWMRKLVKIDV